MHRIEPVCTALLRSDGGIQGVYHIQVYEEAVYPTQRLVCPNRASTPMHGPRTDVKAVS